MTEVAARRCLVLGGNGLLGQPLCAQLAASGHDVRVFARFESSRELSLGPGISCVRGDFLDHSALAGALDGVDTVFHLVSTTLPKTSNDSPAQEVSTNVLGSAKLLDLCVSMGIKRVVFASSGGTVYGCPQRIPIDEAHPTDPICAYGVGKLAVEKLLHLYERLHGLSSRILRISNVYGEKQSLVRGQGAVGVFLDRVLKQLPVEIWGDGSVVRDYVYAGDVAEAFLTAMNHEGADRIFNIGSGIGLTLDELLSLIERVIGHGVERHYLVGRDFDVSANVLDVQRARNRLGWQANTGIEQGLRRVATWLVNQSAAGTPE